MISKKWRGTGSGFVEKQGIGVINSNMKFLTQTHHLLLGWDV